MAVPKNNFATGDQFAATDANNLANALPQSGTYASRPTAGLVGRLYYCTDCDAVYRDNGTSWAKIQVGGGAGPSIADPPTTGWTAVNMVAGASWASDKDAMLFTLPSNGTGDNFNYQYRTYPTPPFTLTVYMELSRNIGLTRSSGYLLGGIGLSDGTKFIEMGLGDVPTSAGSPWTPGLNIQAQQATGLTSVTYLYFAAPVQWVGGTPKWWQFNDDGTNRNLFYSMNGLDWVRVLSESRTNFLTPTRIGIILDNFTGNTGYLRLRSWSGVS